MCYWSLLKPTPLTDPRSIATFGTPPYVCICKKRGCSKNGVTFCCVHPLNFKEGSGQKVGTMGDSKPGPLASYSYIVQHALFPTTQTWSDLVRFFRDKADKTHVDGVFTALALVSLCVNNLIRHPMIEKRTCVFL